VVLYSTTKSRTARLLEEQRIDVFRVNDIDPVYLRVGVLTDISDKELVWLASNGDRNAFGLLYERYIDRIYNYVYYRTGDHSDAEDLTAKVFFRAMRHIGNYQDRGVPFSAWLYRIAHNLVANWYRDNSRKKVLYLEETFPPPKEDTHPEGTLLYLEEKENLLRVVQGLHPDRQELLILKFVNECSNAEIGEIMGRTEGAIKSLYHRTLIALREELNARVLSGEVKEMGRRSCSE
jgi:RNA polymerase sigma-70 factor (ECF subfamily)